MSTPRHLKYFKCIDNQFPSSVAEWSDTLPQKGHIYSVRRRYADDYPDDTTAEEAYLLWEIPDSGSGRKNETYFSAKYFHEIDGAEIESPLDMDEVAIEEINRRFIHRVDKLRRMYAGVSSYLKSYHDGTMEIEVISGNAGYFSAKTPHEVFRNIPSGWRINPELKTARGFRMRIYLTRQIQGFLTSPEKAESVLQKIKQQKELPKRLMLELEGCL